MFGNFEDSNCKWKEIVVFWDVI